MGKNFINFAYFIRIMLKYRHVRTNYMLSHIASAKPTKLEKLVSNNGSKSPIGGKGGS